MRRRLGLTSVRGLGRYPQSEAAAGGDLATADSSPEVRERPRVSADGRWWWDGQRWLATTTKDGLWHWNGRAWRPTIELATTRPRDLATTLAMLAEDRYARGAAVLVERAREWRPDGEVRGLIGSATGLRRRLLGVERAFTRPAVATGLLRRLTARQEHRQQLEEEQALVDTEYRSLMVRIGRLAPRPTVKEADDLLEIARLLDQRATRITDALAAADNAERARARAIEAAQRQLKAAEDARRSAVDAAARSAARAAEEHSEEMRALGGRLSAALTPEVGEPLAQVGPLRAHPAFVETPAGRLPAEAVEAWTGPAVTLWRDHRERLQDALVLETHESEAFLRCLTERRHDQFLMLAARSRTVLWHCPAGEERPLRRFATAVNQQVPQATALAAARAEAVRAVEADMAALAARAPGADEARAALARAESDPELLRPIEDARRALEAASQEPPALVEARRHVAAESRAVGVPPRPLVRLEPQRTSR